MLKIYQYLPCLCACALLLGGMSGAADTPDTSEAPASAATAAPDEPPPAPEPVQDTVYTSQELVDWLFDHHDQGGTVYLGADLIVDSRAPRQTPLSPVEIIANSFTIYIKPGGVWHVSGPVTVSGGKTVFYVEDGGVLNLYSDGLVHAEGDGAITILTESLTGIHSDFGRVRAAGSGAAAISAPHGLTLSTALASADGENAAAIRSGGPVDLTYCSVSATGEKSLSVDASGEVLLDTTKASPLAPQSTALARTVRPVDAAPLYIALGAQPRFPSFVRAALKAEGRDELLVRIPLRWSAYEINTDTEAIFTVSAILEPLLPEIGVHFPERYETQIHVMNPDLPRLISASVKRNQLILNTFSKRSASQYVIHSSGDGGITWNTVTLSGDSKTLSVPNRFAPESTLLFYYEEMRESGERLRSNLLEVHLAKDNDILSQPGNGDYDGGDQSGGGSPEPPFGWSEVPEEEKDALAPPTDEPLGQASPSQPAGKPGSPELALPMPVPVLPIISSMDETQQVPSRTDDALAKKINDFSEHAPLLLQSSEHITVSPMPRLTAASPPPSTAAAASAADTCVQPIQISEPFAEITEAAPGQADSQPARPAAPARGTPKKRLSPPVVAVTGAASLLFSILIGRTLHRGRP